MTVPLRVWRARPSGIGSVCPWPHGRHSAAMKCSGILGMTAKRRLGCGKCPNMIMSLIWIITRLPLTVTGCIRRIWRNSSAVGTGLPMTIRKPCAYWGCGQTNPCSGTAVSSIRNTAIKMSAGSAGSLKTSGVLLLCTTGGRRTSGMPIICSAMIITAFTTCTIWRG